MGVTLCLILGFVLFSSVYAQTTEAQNSTTNLLKTETYKKAQGESAIEIEKFVSNDFHNKNNVYTVAHSPETEKFLNVDFEEEKTTKGHDFDFYTDLTTPKSLFFDQKYKDAVESVDQELEHLDEEEEVNKDEKVADLEEMYEKTKRNDTTAELNYVNYKNISKNDEKLKNNLHKDVVIEDGTNLNFKSSYNHTIVIDENDEPKTNETIQESSTISNVIPVKGDLENSESVTVKTAILTTTSKSIENSSHILSNRIETETVKAVNEIIPISKFPEVTTESVTTTEKITTTDLPVTESESNPTTKEEEQTTETTIKDEQTSTIETTTKEEETTTNQQVTEATTTTEVETSTSVVTETSASPWETTTLQETTTEMSVSSTIENLYLSDATVAATTEAALETSTEKELTTTTIQIETTILPKWRKIETFTTESENTTDFVSPDFYEHTDPPEDKTGTIVAITISTVGGVCLVLLAILLIVMRKRQKRFNYGQRCRPVSLDDYSMDNVSVYNNSVRRKGMARVSKRSYGNPAFEDPVSVSHPLNFPALGKFASNLEEITSEFEEIPVITARTTELPEGCDTKNRYANVIPLPETRVFLISLEGQPTSDYINANYVTGPKNTKGFYIACQAPLQNTVDDFWRMIWEQEVKVVLMLTHLFENGVEKCVDYLPPSEVLDCHRLFGDFQVTLKKREVKEKYIISSLQLKNMVSNSWREITHFWYSGWPEKGVPSEANSLIAYLIEARSYMKSLSLDRKNENIKNVLNPVVVHCSPGTGRTGVVIACDIAIREFEQNRLVDIPKIVYRIRRDRASSVQTKDQYAFIYKVISLYATKLTGGALDSL